MEKQVKRKEEMKTERQTNIWKEDDGKPGEEEGRDEDRKTGEHVARGKNDEEEREKRRRRGEDRRRAANKDSGKKEEEKRRKRRRKRKR